MTLPIQHSAGPVRCLAVYSVDDDVAVHINAHTVCGTVEVQVLMQMLTVRMPLRACFKGSHIDLSASIYSAAGVQEHQHHYLFRRSLGVRRRSTRHEAPTVTPVTLRSNACDPADPDLT